MRRYGGLGAIHQAIVSTVMNLWEP